MRERLTTLDWQREMLAEAGMGEAALPTVQAGAFARAPEVRNARRRERHARIAAAASAAPLALDARLEAGLIATMVTMMGLAPGYVREELAEMVHHPLWTAFFLFGLPFLFHWLGGWVVLAFMIWMLVDTVQYLNYLRQAPAPALPVDPGVGASRGTALAGTLLAALAAELVVEALLMAAGTAIGLGW